MYLVWSKSEELVGLVQHQVVKTQEHEAVTGQQTDETEGSGHQQSTSLEENKKKLSYYATFQVGNVDFHY